LWRRIVYIGTHGDLLVDTTRKTLSHGSMSSRHNFELCLRLDAAHWSMRGVSMGHVLGVWSADMLNTASTNVILTFVPFH